MTLEALKKLNKLQAELKAKTIDKALTDRNFYERTSEMFKPLIESNEKQTEDINKNFKITRREYEEDKCYVGYFR